MDSERIVRQVRSPPGAARRRLRAGWEESPVRAAGPDANAHAAVWPREIAGATAGRKTARKTGRRQLPIRLARSVSPAMTERARAADEPWPWRFGQPSWRTLSLFPYTCFLTGRSLPAFRSARLGHSDEAGNVNLRANAPQPCPARRGADNPVREFAGLSSSAQRQRTRQSAAAADWTVCPPRWWAGHD